LIAFDDGSGPALYAGGTFQSAGGVSASRIARWDGQGWSPLGSGMNNTVESLAVFDDGSGPSLYAGGLFTTAGGQAANHIARWDGQGWSPLGAGTDNSVSAMIVFDDGSGAGPALYAGGHFDSAGGLEANHVARWNGQGWSTLDRGTNDAVRGLAAGDVGSGAGPALFAGGEFSAAGGAKANGVAKWDGQSWSPLGKGIGQAVHDVEMFDDGSGGGPALYAGGAFEIAGIVRAQHVARWDGRQWSQLGKGTPLWVYDLAVFDGGTGTGPALLAAGIFESSPGGDSFVARWDCPAIQALPGCFGNPAALATPTSERSIGGTLEVALVTDQIATGLGVVFLGFDGTDAAGCGQLAPGLGELLLALAPPPLLAGSGNLSAGAAAFALPIPADPLLVGLEVALQGAALGVFNPGVPLELSNALSVTITQ
jgi:hypothetical protein